MAQCVAYGFYLHQKVSNMVLVFFSTKTGLGGLKPGLRDFKSGFRGLKPALIDLMLGLGRSLSRTQKHQPKPQARMKEKSKLFRAF